MRSSLRRREGAVFLRAVVPGDVRLEEHAFLRDLHRVAGEPHLDLFATEAVRDEVAAAREAHVAGGVDLALHRRARGQWRRGARPGPRRSGPRGRLGSGGVAACVASDEHAAMGDLDEAVAEAELDRLAGEPGADVVARRLEADLPVRGDEARERAQLGRLVLGCAFEQRDRLRRRAGELEALEGGAPCRCPGGDARCCSV